MSRKIFGALRTLVGVAAGCLMASSVVAQPLEKLSVRLDWTPWAIHSAFHLAQEKGWYEKAGLDVHIEDGNGSVTTVQIVGAGDSFDVGHAGLASMMVARDKGLPVKAIEVFLRKNDIGLLVPEDSDIKSPADLKGKKVVYTAGSLEAPFVDPFLKEGGLTRRDIDLLNVEAASKATAYAVGRADAIVTTIPYVIVFVSESRPSVAIPFSDYGMNMPSYGLFANEKALETKREAISKFASVTARAWEYIFDGNQDEAVEALYKQRPRARIDAKIVRGQLDALYEYFGSPAKGERIGAPVPADWEEAVSTLRAVGLIGNELQATDFYASDLVFPEKYDDMVAQ